MYDVTSLYKPSSCEIGSEAIMNNMEYEQTEDMQFDDTDLISSQQEKQVPKQKPIESVTEILQHLISKDSIPKEDLRKTWNNKKSEREKLLKQWNKAKESLAYWVSKTLFLEYQLNQNGKELERMRGRMLADCLSEN